MHDTAMCELPNELDSLSTETLLVVLDALPVGAFLIEKNRVYCNRAAEKLTGYNRKELLSTATFFPLLFAEAADEARAFLSTESEGSPAGRYFSINTKNGPTQIVQLVPSRSSRQLCTMFAASADRDAERERVAAVAKFRRMAEASVGAFFLVDESCEIIDANHECERIYGYGRDQLLAKSVLDLVQPEGRDEAAAALRSALGQGHGRVESSHILSNGTAIDAELRFLRLPDEPYFFMFVRDITEQKREEQRRVEREALLRAIFDSVPFDFFALDRDGRYTMVSSKTVRTWGDPAGKTVPDFTAGTSMAPYAAKWMDCNRRALSGETIDGEAVFIWHGEEHVVQEIVAPIRDPQQGIIGTFGINLDITQQKVFEKALKESEERYRRLSALTSDYVYCCARRGDSPFKVEWLGGAIESITGYSESDIFERGCWMDFVHPDDRERVAAGRLSLRPGESASEEFRIICKNGEICWIRESFRCEQGNSEGELRLYGASQNITSTKDAEIALRNVEEIFRLFLEHSPAYVVFKDENHRVLRLSRNFEGLLGRPLHQLIGTTAADIFPAKLAQKIMQDDQRVLESGKTMQVEEELQGRFYSSTKFVIPQNDKPSIVVTIKTEITARKEAEEALCRLNQLLDRRVAERTAQLEAAILEQESFSYSVSHDLRAPLRHINSFSAILMEDYSELLPDQARDYLTRICKATKRMGQLIDNLLKLSRVSRIVVKRSPVNLSELAAKISLMLKEIEPERSVEFEIEPGLYASCDKILVRQLFENLLGNAWKYTARAASPRVRFGMRHTSEGAVFFIEDNGAGFDMIYKDKLFIPFQRLHGSEYEGNGIGLATAQRIVQRHGGTIWAEGAEGEGAAFYFTLPG